MLQQDQKPRSLFLADMLNNVIVLAACGLAIGWLLGIGVLVQPLAQWPGVHLGALVCLILLSLAMALPKRWRLVPTALTALAVGIAAYHVAEYTLHLTLALSQMLPGAQTFPESLQTGWRMSFATASCTIFMGLSVALQRSQVRAPVTTAFALAAPCIAMIMALHSFFVVPYNLDYRDFSPLRTISLDSMVLYGLFALTLAVRAWHELARDKVRRLDHYVAWCALGLTALVLIVWDYEERSGWNQRASETEVKLTVAQSALSATLHDLGMGQSRLANRWAIYGPPTQNQWERDALAMQAGYSVLFTIAYLDQDKIVRWRVAGNDGAPGELGRPLQLDPMSQTAFDNAVHLKAVQMTPWVDLTPGVRGTWFVAPVFTGDALQGYIVASLRAVDLQRMAKEALGDGFDFFLRDTASVPVGAIPTETLSGLALRASRDLNIFGQSWTLTVWPTEAYVTARRTHLPDMTLLFGLFTALLVSLTLLQTRQGRISQSRAEVLAGMLATTMDNISDAFMTIDRSWRITYANAQAARLTNQTTDQLIGSFVRRAPEEPADRQRDAALALAMDGKGTQRFSTRLQTTGLWVDATAYPTADGIAVHFRDVTQERARAERLQLLEAAVSRQNDVLIITEPDVSDCPEAPRIVYVNDAFTRLTGYTREEAIGRSPRFLQGPKTQRAELDRIRAALSAREPVLAELINYSKTGQEYWLEVDIAPIFDDAGNCTHFVGVERDVTRRKRTLEDMILAQERFNHVAEATNDIVWDADLLAGSIWFNENFHKILGHSRKQSVRPLEDWERLVHPEDLPRVLKALRDAVASNAPQVITDYRISRQDGTYAIVMDRAKIIRNAEGEVVRLVGTMADMTERRAMAASLHQSQQLQVIGQLTGGVAHDFNNLLTVILGNAELLTDRLADQPKLQKLAEATITAALRGADLTSRLLAFARRQPLDPKVIAVADQLTGMQDWLHRTLPQNVEIEVSAAPDLWPIEVDTVQLETCLLNLAINAGDAMPTGGNLHIHAENRAVDVDSFKGIPEAAAGDYVCISVNDTGIGMDEQTKVRAFEPFFTTKSLGKGSGLGLSMVYGFVRQSSGFARIESSPGKGATVHLFFPRSSSDQVVIPALANTETPMGGDEHILLVEDDDMVRENVITQLENLGYRVSAAPTGTAALKILQRIPDIALLFTDIVMPGEMSGPELVAQARTLRPDLPVLYTSGYSEEAITRGGRLSPGIHLLSKPYLVADLARKVRSVLG